MRAGVSKINPNPFTTRPELDGTFGVVASTHWIATAVGMATLEKGGNAFDAAVATAFTLQVVEPHLNGPGGDVPVILYDVKRGKAGGHLRPGTGAGGGDYRALPRSRLGHGAGHRIACRLRAGDVRHLDAAAARLRHHAAGRRAGAGDFLRARRPSAGRARQRHHRHGGKFVPRALADLGGNLFARRRGAEAGHAIQQPHARRNLCPRAARGRKRRRRSRRADRSRPQDVVARLRRRGDRQVLPHAGRHGRFRRAPPRRAHRRRHGALAGAGRGAARLRLWPLHGVQARRLEPGPGDVAAIGAAAGLTISTRSIRPDRTSSICRSRPPSSPMPTAKRSTAIPIL